MSTALKIPYFIYIILIALPILIVATALTAILTMIFAPLLPNSYWAYIPARAWSRLFCILTFVKVKTNGFGHLDKNQSYIFAANHQSMFDIFVIYGWIPFIFKWIMKSDLRKIPLVGKACESAGHIFIDRTNPKAAQNSLKAAEEKLTNGNSVVVFPEGTRTRTGEMNRFKKGAFVLATDLKLPIVPITLSGSFERMPVGSKMVRPGTITMTVHEPIITSQYSEKPSKELIDKTWEVVNSSL